MTSCLVCLPTPSQSRVPRSAARTPSDSTGAVSLRRRHRGTGPGTPRLPRRSTRATVPLGRLASGSWSQLSTSTLDKTRPLLAGTMESISARGQKSSAACEMMCRRRLITRQLFGKHPEKCRNLPYESTEKCQIRAAQITEKCRNGRVEITEKCKTARKQGCGIAYVPT